MWYCVYDHVKQANNYRLLQPSQWSDTVNYERNFVSQSCPHSSYCDCANAVAYRATELGQIWISREDGNRREKERETEALRIKV